MEGWPSGEVRDLGKLIYSGIDVENKNRTKPQEELWFLRTREGTVKGEKLWKEKRADREGRGAEKYGDESKRKNR